MMPEKILITDTAGLVGFDTDVLYPFIRTGQKS